MADLALMLLVFVLSFGVGYLLISRVPPLLHTPLMSMTNAISAVTILGAALSFAVPTSPSGKVLGALALVTAAFNLVGGSRSPTGWRDCSRSIRTAQPAGEPVVRRQPHRPLLLRSADGLCVSRGVHHV